MPTDPAPETIAFPDVESRVLERDEAAYRTARTVLAAPGAWQAYLSKVLPPIEGELPK